LGAEWYQVSDTEGICEGLEEVEPLVSVILHALKLIDSRNNGGCGTRRREARPMPLQLSNDTHIYVQGKMLPY
jgi:hypothetical protein